MTPPATDTALRMTRTDLENMLVEIVEETCQRRSGQICVSKLEARAIFDRFRALFARLGAFDLGSYDG